MQVFLARILAAWIAGLAGWLMVKFGIAITPEDQANFVTHLVGIVIPAMTTIYAIIHKMVSKKLNPGDAASSHLAEREASETAAIKASERFSR